MPTIVTTQKDFDGKGNDRVFRQWVKPGQVELTIRRKSQAYNMDHTTFTVEND